MKPTKWLRKVRIERCKAHRSNEEAQEAGKPFYCVMTWEGEEDDASELDWNIKCPSSEWFSRNFSTAKERDAGIKAFKAALNEFCDRIDAI